MSIAKGYGLVCVGFGIASGLALSQAAVFYTQDPFLNGNEQIKEQFYSSLLNGVMLFSVVVIATLLLLMLSKLKGN